MGNELVSRNSGRRTGARAAGLALAAAISLTACGTPPWTEAGLSGATPTPTPTATPQQIITIVNELATGSAQHQLAAGNIGLTVDYWSTLSMDKWTADANKPLNFSMVANLTDDGGQGVFLSQVTLVAAVSGPDGALPAPAPITDRTTVNPGYRVKTPYSYSQTFILPALDPAATSVSLSINYELLLQTTPTSSEYAKQTANDTVTIAIVP